MLYFLTSLCPPSSGAELSSRECNAWTSRGHHKRGLHAHGAITNDWGKREDGEQWLAHLGKPPRGEACFDYTFVLIAGHS